MMRRGLALLPLGLLLLAAAEISMFVLVTHAIGAALAVLLVAAFTLVGLVLLRREGVRGWRAFRSAAEAGDRPGPQVADSLIGLLGALLLAVPGFVTGVAGLLLLIPGVRTLAGRGVERGATRRMSGLVADEVFGPRRVRVRRGAPVRPDIPQPSAEPVDAEVIEGEIVR